MEVFEKRRVDRTDFERWRNFHANLKQTIESWKVLYDYFLHPCCAVSTDPVAGRNFFYVRSDKIRRDKTTR